jgi:hypothetical protein
MVSFNTPAASRKPTDLAERIFIIEGCVTIFVSLACWPAVPPFPEDCKFLSPENKALLLARVKADGGHVADDDITFKKALYFLKDWKIWAGLVAQHKSHLCTY